MQRKYVLFIYFLEKISKAWYKFNLSKIVYVLHAWIINPMDKLYLSAAEAFYMTKEKKSH